MFKKSTKSALVLSVISMIVCLALLVGTTFAWFTDSVVSTNNIIKSGNLEIKLYYQNDEVTTWSEVGDTTNIFKTNTLWEPGHTEVVKLRVENAGTLALKYQLGINVASEQGSVNVNDEPFKLSDHILFGVTTEAVTDRASAVAAVKDDAKALREGYTNSAKLLAGEPTDEKAFDEVTLVVYMPETVGNEANYKNGAAVPTINLGLNLVATQDTVESDSFDELYDTDATYPVFAATKKADGEPAELEADRVAVTVPAEAEGGEYSLKVENQNENTDANGETTVSLDITLMKDGVPVVAEPGVEYDVVVDIGAGRVIGAVTHKGTLVSEDNWDYNEVTGLLTITTDSFSPFAVIFKTPVAKVGNDDYYTIDDAVANWKANTTLTLRTDVTLSDIIILKSTEHHILNLGTYTMTAASGKNAIEITPEGAGTAARSCLTINADTDNPGGINAGGKACIYYKKTNGINDRLMVTINGGVFDGTISSSSNNGGQACPYFVINGGTFNKSVNLTKAMLKITGGTFHNMLSCTGDSTAHRLISGGTFKSLTFMTADAANKFAIGTDKQTYNVGLYVDDNGYLVVGGPVITEPGDRFEAKITATKWSSYLKYSSAATHGLYYTDADLALAKDANAEIF